MSAAGAAFFSAPGGAFLSAPSGSFSRAFDRSFLRTLGRSLLGAFGRRNPFFALFLLLFDHLDLAQDGFRRRRCLGGFLFLRARRSNRDDRDLLVADHLTMGGGGDFTQMNGLADLKVAHIHGDLLRQIFGEPAHAILKSTCSSTPPSVFTPSASPTVSTGTRMVTFSFSATS